MVYDKRNETDNAATFYLRSYDLSQEINYYRQLSVAASGIAILYQKRDSLDKALFYYKKAMEAAKMLNSSHAQATILLHMSSAYQDQKLFEEAVALNKQQLEIARTEENRFLEAQGLENLAELYGDQEDLTRSTQYFNKAKSTYEDIGYSINQVIVTNKLARNFLELGQLTEAITSGREALDGARALNSLEQVQDRK